MGIIKEYMYNLNAVVLLWDCRGKVHVRDKGVRATALRPLAVMDFNYNGESISDRRTLDQSRAVLFAAAQYFGGIDNKPLDIFPFKLAYDMVQESWRKFLCDRELDVGILEAR